MEKIKEFLDKPVGKIALVAIGAAATYLVLKRKKRSNARRY